MKNQTNRPLLYAGLVINIISFFILTVCSALYIFYIARDLNIDAIEDSTIINLLINIFLILFSLVEVILSVISLFRTKWSLEKFNAKRWLILSIIIMNITSFILGVIEMKTIGFDIVILFIVLALITSTVFIILEYYKNKVELTKQSASSEQK